MLRLEIDVTRLADPWRQVGLSLVGPAGSIAPLAHPMTLARARVGPDSWLIEVVESYGGTESLLVEGDRSQIRITAGSGGVCPLYVVLDGTVLRGSWNPADLLGTVSPTRLVDRAIARLLTRRQRYSAETMFDGLYKVTERAVVTANRRGISVQYPKPAPHVIRARDLRCGIDPVEVFGRLLTARVTSLAAASGLRLATEISGGLDSAAVTTSTIHAGAAAGLVSVGLVVGGEIGAEQRVRRQAIINHLRLRDITVPASAHLPFEARGPRTPDHPHYADGDVYVEAFDQLRHSLRDDGVQTVLTGFGGDELMALRGSERASGQMPPEPPLPGWLGPRALDALPDLETNVAPSSPVAVSTLMVFAARNPAYVACGLWPVAPLADAGLLRLCESLPADWRSNKSLLRYYLRRSGLGPQVTHPGTVESFRYVMDAALQTTGAAMLTQMLDDSILVSLGYVDRRSLAVVHRRLVQERVVPPLLYDTLAVERSLQSVRSAEGRSV